MLGLQILIDGFAISSLYAIGAMGFTLIFGVSGVLNLSHGGIMAIAAVIGWLAAGDLGLGTYLGTLVGVIAGLVASYVTYFVVILPIQRSRAIPRDETEIFILTGTLLWGIMIQVGLAWLFTDNPLTMRPLIEGVTYIAGVLLTSFLGVSSASAGQLTASAFSIVVLGGLGSVSGSLVAAYVVGYLETITAYLIAPTLRPIPALLLLVLVIYVRPQGILGRR